MVVSGFRIDLGVVHPDKAGAYLAGIECDGLTYHRSATARDRDQVREGVLRNLGWEILRVWSTDWFMHPAEVLDHIDAALIELLDTSRARALEHAAPAREMAECNPVGERVVLDEGEEEGTSLIAEFQSPETDFEEQEVYASGQVVNAPLISSENAAVELESPEHACDPSLFFESSHTDSLTRLISDVVAARGPISETMLYRHIARLYGWQRAGRRIQERVMACIGENECGRENGNLFVWKPGSYQKVIPFRSHLPRPPRDTPQAEIVGLIHEQSHVLKSEDPAKEIATLLGLGRLSKDTRAYLDTCISHHQKLTSEPLD